VPLKVRPDDGDYKVCPIQKNKDRADGGDRVREYECGFTDRSVKIKLTLRVKPIRSSLKIC